MDALPFCQATLHRVRCTQGPYFTLIKGYPANPKSIGEMIRKRRLDLGLRQRDIAEIIGCDKMTIINWEKGHTLPRINHMGAVVKFLGYNPFEKCDTMAQHLMNHRKALGISQKDFARKLGVDQSTLARWERGEREPVGRFKAIVESEITLNTGGANSRH